MRKWKSSLRTEETGIDLCFAKLPLAAVLKINCRGAGREVSEEAPLLLRVRGGDGWPSMGQSEWAEGTRFRRCSGGRTHGIPQRLKEGVRGRTREARATLQFGAWAPGRQRRVGGYLPPRACCPALS